MRNNPRAPRNGLAILALLGATVAATFLMAQRMPGAGDGVTRLRVTNQTIVPGVKRLGMNLGFQDFYDAGQMTKNLLFRNPGFEAMTYRTIFHCQAGGSSVCVDRRQGVQFPADFWNGATFEVLDGAAAGRRGYVLSCGKDRDGYGLTLDSKGKPLGVGDWLVAYREVPGDPAAGWWPNLNGGAKLTAERRDLSPETLGHQALRIEASGPGQSARINSYFDTLDGFTFVRLRGRYRLSFRAKSLNGSRMVHVHVARNTPGKIPNLEQDVRIGPAWGDYSQDFAANEGAGPTGTVEVSFTVTGGDMLLDDVDLEQTSGDPANHTAFRDEVLETLKQLRPGVLRLMSTNAGLGNTVDDLLAPPMARQRGGYSGWYVKQEDIPIGIPEFLELCQEVGAEPWIVAPTAMSKEEARKLAEYFAGSPATAGGAMRAAGGHSLPWTQVFRTIHIEFGNEAWNGVFLGESMDDTAAYGRRSNTVFAAFRAAAGPDAARFDLSVGAQADWPAKDSVLLTAAPGANSMAIAPYLMHSVTRWSSDDELYGALLAEPEYMSRVGEVEAAQNLALGRRMAVYEVNLHTTEGTIPQDVLDRFTPSTAAGVAVAGHMLRMLRDHGIRDQMLYSLSQFQYKRSDGKLARLWGAVVEMGANGRKRPQFLAESLANRAIRGDLMRIEVSGENPMHDLADGNDGVHLKGVHEIDAYAFQDGKSHGLIVFNYGLHQVRRVELDAPGLASNPGVSLWRLVSPGPGATNEGAVQVRIEKEPFHGTALSLAPCSMAVLEWQE
jgi:hypothetical protein